jgi:HNH endonuclease
MAGRKPAPIETRFWEKVEKTDSCWRWTANKNNKGYGMIYWGKYARKCVAHRVSWELHYGVVPEGYEVTHKCDNPECTRPDHLVARTHRDNMLDKLYKGRAYPDGWLENVRAAVKASRKLTPEQAGEAKAMLTAGMAMRAVARHFGCDRDAIKCWL